MSDGASMEERSGVPTTRVSLPGKYVSQPGIPNKITSQNRAVKRLALPGMAFDSWMKVRAPTPRPASAGGSEVKPPMPTTAWAPKSRTIRFVWRKVRQNFHPKEMICGESSDGRPMPGTVAKVSSG